METYFKEVGKLTCKLDKDCEYELFRRLHQENDMSARDRIAKANLRFVIETAKSYRGMGVDFPDLVSEGNEGLMKAIDHFDESKGVKFITYATFWIRDSMRSAIRKCPENKTVDAKVDDYLGEFAEKERKMYLRHSGTDNSLDVEDDTEERMDKWQNLDTVNTILPCLTEKERYVIERNFGLNGKKEMSLKDIGDELNLTKERVRQIRNDGMMKMRNEILSSRICVFD